MADGIVYYTWYFNDWLGSGTRAEMSMEDRAIYRDLLDHQAAKESLPDSVQAMANMALCSPGQIKAFLERWGEELFPRGEDGRRRNAKLAAARNAVLDSRERRSLAGQKGAEVRWSNRDDDGNANGDAIGGANGKRGFGSGSGNNQGNKRQGTRAREPSWQDVEIPSTLKTERFQAAWRDYAEHRRQIKKTMTALAAKKAMNKLAEAGEGPAVAALNESIQNGWQGVFPDKHAGEPSEGTRLSSEAEIDEILAEAQDEIEGLEWPDD